MNTLRVEENEAMAFGHPGCLKCRTSLHWTGFCQVHRSLDCETCGKRYISNAGHSLCAHCREKRLRMCTAYSHVVGVE